VSAAPAESTGRGRGRLSLAAIDWKVQDVQRVLDDFSDLVASAADENEDEDEDEAAAVGVGFEAQVEAGADVTAAPGLPSPGATPPLTAVVPAPAPPTSAGAVPQPAGRGAGPVLELCSDDPDHQAALRYSRALYDLARSVGVHGNTPRPQHTHKTKRALLLEFDR